MLLGMLVSFFFCIDACMLFGRGVIVEGECKYHDDAVVAPPISSPYIITHCASGVCRPFLIYEEGVVTNQCKITRAVSFCDIWSHHQPRARPSHTNNC